MHALLRWLIDTLVRLFFPVVRVTGLDRVPTTGPVLFVPNHNNGLLDPIVVRLATGRPVRFLAKSTLFGNPIGKLTMNAFGAIPVYRTRDEGPTAGPGADRSAGNERTFALCRAALGRGESLALFPEGTSHSDPQLKPFKTGAARIALSSEAEHGFALGLRIVPTAIVYDAKTIFRSSALVALGESIGVAEYAAAYAEDAHEAARALTHAMREALEQEALTADTRELLEGIAAVSGYAAESAEDAHDLAKRHARAKALLRGYRTLAARDPATLENLVAEARAYVDTLRQLGIDDPWGVEVGRVGAGAVVREVLVLGLLAPFALVGALTSWIPYRLTGAIADRAEEDVRSTFKLLVALAVLPVFWLLEVVAVGFAVHLLAALALALAVVPTGYAALRFGERVSRARTALAHAWLRRGRPSVVAELVAKRRALAMRVEAALRDSTALA